MKNNLPFFGQISIVWVEVIIRYYADSEIRFCFVLKEWQVSDEVVSE
jgi:hypothetical protein